MHSSLIVNSNKIDLSFNLNEQTGKPDITPLFLPIGIEIENNLSVGSGKCKDFRSKVTFDEKIPQADPYNINQWGLPSSMQESRS